MKAKKDGETCSHEIKIGNGVLGTRSFYLFIKI